jgi:class 3 adenylate cyclase
MAMILLQKEARRLAELHDGTFVRSTGIGVLLCFGGASAALEAAADLQAAFARGAAAVNLAAPALRIGMHAGEFVEIGEGNIHGAAVNMAQAITEGAAAGEIMLTDAVASRLPPSRLHTLRPAGTQQVKGQPVPVQVLAT